MNQAQIDEQYRKGFHQGYRDGYRNIHADPVYAHSQFRKGYLQGLRDGTLDKKMGYRSDYCWYGP